LEGILASYELVPRERSFEAKMEIQNIIYELAEKYPFLKNVEAHLCPGGFKGLILVDLRGIKNSVNTSVLEEVKSDFINTFYTRQRDGKIRYITRILILDALVPTDIEEIRKAMERIKEKVKGRWRITLKTRGFPVDRMELIKKAAEPISQPVDLKNPEYVVIINILGDVTGISVVKAEEVSKRWRR